MYFQPRISFQPRVVLNRESDLVLDEYDRDSASASTRDSTSTSARELEIIEKFLCPHHL